MRLLFAPLLVLLALLRTGVSAAPPVAHGDGSSAPPGAALASGAPSRASDIPGDGTGTLPLDVTSVQRRRLQTLRPLFLKLNAALRLQETVGIDAASQAVQALTAKHPDFVLALYRLVQLYHGQGRLGEARALFKARTGQNRADAAAHYGLAVVHLFEGREAAGAMLQEALAAVSAGCPDWRCYSVLASAWKAAGLREEGTTYFESAANTRDHQRAGLARLGHALLQLGIPEHSTGVETALRQAAALLEPGRGRESALHFLGEHLKGQRRFLDATAAFQAAATIFAEMGDRQNEGRDLFYAAASLKQLGRPGEALQLYASSLAPVRDVGDRESEINLLLDMSEVHRQLGQPLLVAARLAEAREVLTRYSNPYLESMLLLNEANLHYLKGGVKQSLELYQAAQALCENAGNSACQATVESNLAHVWQTLGDSGLATRHFNHALSLWQELGDLLRAGQTLHNRGDNLLQLGDVEGAFINLEAALKLHRDAGDTEFEALTLASLADVARLREGPSAALPFLEKALEIARSSGHRRNEGVVLEKLARVCQEQGEVATAAAHAARAIVILGESGLQLEAALAQRTLARIELTLSQPAAALARLQEAREVVHLQGATREEAGMLSVMARAREAAGDPDGARADIELSLDLAREALMLSGTPHLESTFFASVAQDYSYAVHLLTGASARRATPTDADLETTFALGEWARAHSFHRWLHLASSDLAADAPLALRERLLKARDALYEAQLVAGLPGQSAPPTPSPAGMSSVSDDASVAQHRRAEAEEAWRGAEQALLEASPLYRQLRRPRFASTGDLRKALDGKTALVAYLLGPEQSFAWLITREGMKIERLPAAGTLSSQVEALLVRLADPRSLVTAIQQEAFALYRQLLPFADSLPQDADLVIIPDGTLGRLPFEALVSEAPGQGRAPAWLAEDHRITYSPSATAWLEARTQRADRERSPSLLAIGDPLYPEDRCSERTEADDFHAGANGKPARWRRLCHSREEVERIRKSRRGMSGRDMDRYLFEASATEESLRTLDLAGFSILHFATHGIAFPNTPLRSALVLGQSQTGATAAPEADGYLDLHDILQFRLRADLVVLSACETAAGSPVAGEGVESLARGFLLSGARTVVANRWRVDDAFMARFMGRFYEAMRRHPSDVALSRTRRYFLKQRPYAHPAYWASLALMTGASSLQAGTSTSGRNAVP